MAENDAADASAATDYSEYLKKMDQFFASHTRAAAGFLPQGTTSEPQALPSPSFAPLRTPGQPMGTEQELESVSVGLGRALRLGLQVLNSSLYGILQIVEGVSGNRSAGGWPYPSGSCHRDCCTPTYDCCQFYQDCGCGSPHDGCHGHGAAGHGNMNCQPSVNNCR